MEKVLNTLSLKEDLGIRNKDISRFMQKLQDQKRRILIKDVYDIIKNAKKEAEEKFSENGLSEDEEFEFAEKLTKAMKTNKKMNLEKEFDNKLMKMEKGLLVLQTLEKL